MKINTAIFCFACILLFATASATRSVLDIEVASSSKDSLAKAGATALYEGDQCTVYEGSVQCSTSLPVFACCSDAAADALCNTYASATGTVSCDDPDYTYAGCCKYKEVETSKCEEADDDVDYCDNNEDYPVDSCQPEDSDIAFPKADQDEKCPEGSTFYCCKKSS